MTLQNESKDSTPAGGGDMSWKKALFLGGAVVLLAACSDATAPRPLREGASAANAKAGTVARTFDSTPTVLDDGDCKSGYYVRSGDKDICVLQIDPLP